MIIDFSTIAATILLVLIAPTPGTENHEAGSRYDKPIIKHTKSHDRHEWCNFWASEHTANWIWLKDICPLICIARHKREVHHRPHHGQYCHHCHWIATGATPRLYSSVKELSKHQHENKWKHKRPSKHRQTWSFGHKEAQAHSTTERLSALARCKQILAYPLFAAEVLLHERLIFPVEDTSGRRLLTQEKVNQSNIAFACVPHLDQAECERSLCYNLYYRTMDGTCNNFFRPLLGAAFRPFNRLLPSEYDNWLSEPVGSILPVRPSSREASRIILSSRKAIIHPKYNALLMQWGQFLTHEMAKTTLVPPSKCNVCKNIPGRCMRVFIQPKDPNKNFKNKKCIRVPRSSAICGSGKYQPREQLNENTNFIDGSPIYGSSIGDLPKFRKERTGFLKTLTFNGLRRLLPFDVNKCRNAANCSITFVAGDNRVDLFIGLAAYHIILTREHNRLVTRLQKLNPHWSGDRLFMESRKIVGGEIQAITYRDYLPKILGGAFLRTIGKYHGYDPHTDPTVATEFSTAAFRFGHAMLQEIYPRLDHHFRSISPGSLKFVDGTQHPERLVLDGGIDPILRGMMMLRVKRPQWLTNAVTENMFGSTDLGTINIQRGRDHGLPSYVRFRHLCGLRAAATFDHISHEIKSAKAREQLKQVYGTPHNIDLFVGGLLEDPVGQGLIGPTFACIVGQQFQRTRDGDRFYFENAGVFTREQLVEIRKSSFARLLCDNGDNIDMVARDAFRIGPITLCSQIPQIDLTKWKE